MTVDELIDLTEALTADMDLALLRSGKAELGENLDNDTWLLLVRFLAGERPTASQRRRTGAERYLDDRVSGVPPQLEHEDDGDVPPRVDADLGPIGRDEDGRITIGDGVKLA